jgi:alpha-L-rhamnosidase
MKYATLFCLFLTLNAALFAQTEYLEDLRCEHRINPVGIGAAAPRFSWKYNSGQRNWKQSAYQIQVAGAEDFAPKNLIWDSKKVDSDASVLQAYGGPRLESGKRYFWRVKVWNDKGVESTWKAAFWETGLLALGDWKAKWIESPLDSGTRYQPALMFRKEFNLRKKVARARAYATAHGLYELYINGKKAGDEVLTPGWTVYGKRLQYQTYDVTALLATGPNAVGAMLAGTGAVWPGRPTGAFMAKNWLCCAKYTCNIPMAARNGSFPTTVGNRRTKGRCAKTNCTTAKYTTRKWSSPAGTNPVLTRALGRKRR